MTKEEAIEAMKQGKKVTHSYYTEDEWMTSNPEGDVYTFDDGVKFDSVKFWTLRFHKSWDEGWKIID